MSKIREGRECDECGAPGRRVIVMERGDGATYEVCRACTRDFYLALSEAANVAVRIRETPQ